MFNPAEIFTSLNCRRRRGPKPKTGASIELNTQNSALRAADVSLSTLCAVGACFALSGFAALLYQTAWLRQFSIAFGTSELALVAVLAAYMAGLAMGALAADRYLSRIDRPVLVYGILEAGIAISALCVPLLLSFVQILTSMVLGGLADMPSSEGIGKSLFYLIVGFLVLLIPTSFMGATLPLLTRYAVHREEQIGPRVSLLYSINTAGAVLGTLVAAFFLLPSLGLLWTVWIGVAINLLVFVLAVSIAKQTRESLRSGSAAASKSGARDQLSFIRSALVPLMKPDWIKNTFGKNPAISGTWILPVICLSGITSFAYEVLWTRMLTHVLGGSIYAFATMLATFLTGIALGSAAASRFSATKQQAANSFVVVQLAIGLTSAVVYLFLDQLLPDNADLASRTLFAASVMLPSTFFIGATFPLAVRILTPNAVLIGNATARVYAWNTLGAILGAITAGFWIIPQLGFSGAIRAIVLVNLILAIIVALLLVQRKTLALVCSLVALLSALIFFNPQRPDELVNVSSVNNTLQPASRVQAEEIFYSVGRSATVLVNEIEGNFFIRSNGLPEATVLPKGSIPGIHPQHWLTALPAIARPQASTLLVIGFGGGVALESVPPSIENIDVIELEPEIIEANHSISAQRNIDPLADPRIDLVINDARGALALTEKRYDIIVSQPSHPWTAGASHLYTREFLEIARSHLNDDGVFLQWINWEYLDEGLLRSLAATMQDAFENVRMYQHSPSVLHFVASDGPLNIEEQLLSENSLLRAHPDHFAGLGALTAEDIVYALALDESGVRSLAADAPLTTDNFNRLAMRSNVGITANPSQALFSLLEDDLVWSSATSSRRQQLSTSLSIPRVVSRMLASGMDRQVEAMIAVLENPVQRLLVQGLLQRHRGNSDAMYQALWSAFELQPDNPDVRFLLIRSQLGSIASGNFDTRLQSLISSSGGVEKAIIDGWRYGAQNQWRQMQSLETLLAEATADELWFGVASQLRAQWRIQSNEQGSETSNFREALAIIDRALSVEYSFELVLLRMVASAQSNDESSLLVSADLLLRTTHDRLERAQRGRYQFTGGQAQTTYQQLRFLTNFMAQQTFLGPLSRRAAQIETKAQAISAQIESLL